MLPEGTLSPTEGLSELIVLYVIADRLRGSYSKGWATDTRLLSFQ